MKSVLLISIFLMQFCSVTGQQETQIPEELWENIFSQIAENKENESIEQTQLMEELQFFAQNPINLNNTNKETLEKLQFLSDTQIENLLYYLYMYCPMENIYELQLVEGLYKQDIKNLLPFVYVGKVEKKQPPITWKKLAQYGKHEILTRFDRCLESKKGYETDAYLGNPNYYALKYRYHFSNRIFFGFTGEKDAGEESWGEHIKGFDFNSAYLQANDFEKCKTILLGDFNASFGQGLVLNTNYGFGKSSMVLNTGTRSNGIQRSGSTDEYHSFRGGGLTIKLGKFDFTAFYSNKMMDADTVNGAFTAFKTDGVHRTESDVSKKHTVNMQVMGANISYKSENYQLGTTCINTHLSLPLNPTAQPYNYFYFSGKCQSALSIDYKFRLRKLIFFGEGALNDKGAPALINTLSFHPASNLSIALLHRYYAPQYDALFGNSFGENSRTNNEEGLYIGTEMHPFKNWKFSVYADSYRFPWLKYGVDKPSSGYDIFLQADYNPKQALSLSTRFRFKQKEDNMANDTAFTPTISNYDRGSLRCVLQYTLSENLKLRNALESSYSQKADDEPTWGLLLAQDLSYNFSKIPLSIDLRYEFFDALNYENRLYSYEKDVLYAFSIPALYGKGCRYYLNMKYKLTEKLSFYLKIGQTKYMNKELIGTGLEEIEGNRKTDVRVLVRFKI